MAHATETGETTGTKDKDYMCSATATAVRHLTPSHP